MRQQSALRHFGCSKTRRDLRERIEPSLWKPMCSVEKMATTLLGSSSRVSPTFSRMLVHWLRPLQPRIGYLDTSRSNP
jgi:hypothetical protein